MKLIKNLNDFLKNICYFFNRKRASFTFPFRKQYYKYKILKNIFICPWDVSETVEVVFNCFKLFCEEYPYFFIEQAVCNYNHSCEHMHDIYMELNDIQNYVLYTRENNKILYEKCTDEVVGVTRLFSKPCKNNSKLRELEIEKDKTFKIDHEWDYDELHINMYEHEEDTNAWSIEKEIYEIDLKFAKRILDLSGYIWD